MKCPKCVELGLKSEVRYLWYGDKSYHEDNDDFWDPEGRKHQHRRTISNLYECTRGHYFCTGGVFFCGSVVGCNPVDPRTLKKSLIQHIKEFFCGKEG